MKWRDSQNRDPFLVKTSKTLLIFMKNCGFYGTNSEVPTRACKSRMKRQSESWRFRAISAQNSHRSFYVVIHSNGRLITFSLHRLKEKWFLFPMVCFFVLSSKHKCLFDIMENGRFSTPRFFKSGFYPHSFSGVAEQNWVDENKRSSGRICQIGKRCLCAKIIDIASEM